MLARIEKLEGVAWAAVEATGRFLAVRPAAGAAPGEVADRVEASLGRRGRRAGAALARAQLADRERGDPWFDARSARALSFIEGRLVAVHAAARVARELGLDRAAQEALGEAVRVVFLASLERVHGEGGRESSGWFYGEWPGIAAEVASRLAGELPDRAAVEEAIARCYRR